MDKEYEEVNLPNGDSFRFHPISEYKSKPCESIENIYPTKFMTTEEIEQRNQERKEFVEYLKTVE